MLADGNRVLLVRRAGSGFHDGGLSLPAGHLDGGEDAVGGLLRELSEELTITAERDSCRLAVVCIALPRHGGSRVSQPGLHLGRWAGTPSIGEPDTCSELVWADLGRLPGDLVDYIEAALHALRKGEPLVLCGWDQQDEIGSCGPCVEGLSDIIRWRHGLGQERDRVARRARRVPARTRRWERARCRRRRPRRTCARMTRVGFVLFDLDGVLVDSTSVYRAAWARWATTHGVAEERIWADAHGRRPQDIVRRVAPALNLVAALDEFDSALEDHLKAGCEVMPGARECLARLSAWQWAIVTSGRRRHVNVLLAGCGLPMSSVLVCGEDTPRGKPDPSGFLLAMHRLAAPRASCTVVEDAPAGIQAAKAAGIFVIGVATTHDMDQLAMADQAYPSLAEATPLLVQRAMTIAG